jgi:peptide/nickel transport system substrate-binding protein
VFVFWHRIYFFFSSPAFKTKKIGIEGLYKENSLPPEINQHITLNLITTSENNRISASPLIQEMKISPDYKTYTFTLSKAIWHDGTLLTSSDIKLNLGDANLEIIDQNQFKIITPNPYSPLLSILAKPLYKKNLIGLGPYKVSGIDYRDGYIKTIKLLPQTPNDPSLTYRFYPNEQDLITAFKLGEVDQIRSSFLPEELSHWPKITINQKVETNTTFSAIFLNNEKLNIKQIRQALAYATPKVKTKNERCLGPISPDSWAYNPQIKEYNYNPERAIELMEDNKIESISLIVIDRRLLFQAEEIKKTWKEVLNIDVAITVENQPDIQNYDAILSFRPIPLDPDQYLYWHSTQTKTNLTKTNNSRIDKLLEEGRQIMDQQERKIIYQDFQRYLLEECPAIFLSFPTSYTIIKS